MVVDELNLQQNMTDSQRMLFQSEMNKVRKNRVVAFLLALFLGGIGAHRYYLGDIRTGIFYTLFFWTCIPAAIALVELFLILGRTDRYNERMVTEVIAKVKTFTEVKRGGVTA